MALNLLQGVRVLELALLMPADHVGAILADLGADVIKIEQPPKGDYVRELGGVLAPGISEHHLFFNRHKRSITLDLRTPEGQDVLRKLVASADVLYESGVPGTRAKLGADYETVRGIKPDIIYASFPGFGMTSPYSHIPAHGWGVSALSGLSPAERLPDGRLRVGQSRSGVIGSPGPVICALAIASAVVHRQLTGEGSNLDISMADCNIYAQHVDAFKALNGYEVKIPQVVPGRSEPVRFTFYECQDGQVIAFQAVEKKFWVNFCKLVNREDWIGRGDWRISVDYGTDDPELEREMNILFKTKPLDEWVDLLGNADVPVVPAYTIEQSVHSSYAEARGMVSSYEHPGFGPVRQVAFPVHVNGEGFETTRPAPDAGADTNDILAELGYEPAQIEAFHAKHVV